MKNKKRYKTSRSVFYLSLTMGLSLLFAACSSEEPQASQELEVQAVVGDLLVSTSANRADAQVLDTGTFTGNIYVFTARTSGVAKVDFYIDDPARAGGPFRTESKAPFDLAGASGNAYPLDTRGLGNGIHTVTAAFTLEGSKSYAATATFLVDNGGTLQNTLLASPYPSRLEGKPLTDAVLTGNAYIYLVPEARATQVTYYLNDPARAGQPYQTERYAFFDFAGTVPSGAAGAFDTKSLSEGRHTVTAVVSAGGRQKVVSSSFTVRNKTGAPPPGDAQAGTFTLINADTDAPVAGFDPLRDGAILDLTALPTRNLNIRANVKKVGSVRFDLGGNVTTESVAPYALKGDDGGDYDAWTPAAGDYTLTATPYAQANAKGAALTPFSLRFKVVSEGNGEEGAKGGGKVTGERKLWHPLSVTFDGPNRSESDTATFRNYRLNVTFTHQSGAKVTVPGFFAADGDAAQTGATSGNKWRAYFTPDKTGTWTYSASFRTGKDVAVSLDAKAGQAASFDGASGSFTVSNTDKTEVDNRGKGFLEPVGERYLRFQNGDYFLKGGADSPENFLAYKDFDGTSNGGGTNYLKSYSAHVKDWRPGDPTWQGGKGKGMIGALNYLSSKGMNAVYFLTMNVNGDGKDVWPWTSYGARDTFDVSKLEQWNIVFDHMDKKGLMLHVVTQETENDTLLNRGALGVERKLYYRELVARFGQHLALTWNLGEENTNTDAQRREYADYFRKLDPYDHPIAVHTYPWDHDKVFKPLLGFPNLDAASIQLDKMAGGHEETLKWLRASATAGHPWVVTLDEPGTAEEGVSPDGPGNNHETAREEALWANLMAGGAGVEWYFGYKYANSDLTAEDWRSRDRVWDYTRYALLFVRALPFTQMTSQDALTSVTNDYVFAKKGEVYAIYFKDASDAGTLDLSGASGRFTARWFNPRTGNFEGSTSTVSGGGKVALGSPPKETGRDWVLLLRR